MNQQQQVRQERQQRAAEIMARLKECAGQVLAQYPVEIAYLYGSVARGQPLPTSDIDIALLLTDLPTPYDRLMLELEIQAALEDVCQLSGLDVRTINHAPLVVQGRIVQEGMLIYNLDKARRVAFEVLTRKKYFDFQPVAKRLQQAYFNRLREKGFAGGQSKND